MQVSKTKSSNATKNSLRLTLLSTKCGWPLMKIFVMMGIATLFWSCFICHMTLRPCALLFMYTSRVPHVPTQFWIFSSLLIYVLPSQKSLSMWWPHLKCLNVTPRCTQLHPKTRKRSITYITKLPYLYNRHIDDAYFVPLTSSVMYVHSNTRIMLLDQISIIRWRYRYILQFHTWGNVLSRRESWFRLEFWGSIACKDRTKIRKILKRSADDESSGQ